jgi:hypothetical protein
MPNLLNAHSIRVSSFPDLPPNLAHAEKITPNGITVSVDTICLGHAFRLCSDIITAMEYGAVPAAHALMINRVNEAEKKGFPLTCSLEMCA